MTDARQQQPQIGNNVIPLMPAKTSREGWGQREQEALLLARLAAMPQLEYERARLAAARELKCRVSWLDRKIDLIRSAIASYQGPLPSAKDGSAAGDPITFWPDRGQPLLGFVTATVHRYGRDGHLLVLADGNGTVVQSTPLSAEKLDKLHRRLEETDQ
jgi:hypothetical protein